MTTIQIHFQLEDYVHFNRYCFKKFFKRRGVRWKNEIFTFCIWVLIGMSVVFVSKYYKKWNFGDIVSVDLFVLATLSWVTLSILYNYWSKNLYIRTSVSEKGCTLGRFKITFTDESIREEKQNVSTELSWETILGAEEDQKYLYIFIDAGRAVIIPRKDLSQLQYDEVISILKSKNVFEPAT